MVRVHQAGRRYAGWLSSDDVEGGRALPSAIYVGSRPTFYDDQAMVLLEVHVLDFTGDLYGKDVRVQFTHRIRADARFASAEELATQLQLDCDRARQLLTV